VHAVVVHRPVPVAIVSHEPATAIQLREALLPRDAGTYLADSRSPGRCHDTRQHPQGASCSHRDDRSAGFLMRPSSAVPYLTDIVEAIEHIREKSGARRLKRSSRTGTAMDCAAWNRDHIRGQPPFARADKGPISGPPAAKDCRRRCRIARGPIIIAARMCWISGNIRWMPIDKVTPRREHSGEAMPDPFGSIPG
jgi:hypothetical protein